MKNSPHRIELAGQGIAEVGQRDLEQRALELARSDGRSAINEKDLEQARKEILGEFASGEAPEESAATANLEEWDRPPTASGFQHPNTLLEDENTIAEELVEEGLEEADHDARYQSEKEKR